AARLELDLTGEVRVLDLLVALEEHLIDDRLLIDGDNQRRTGLADANVGEHTGGEQALDRCVDIGRTEIAAGTNIDVIANRFRVDTSVPTHFDTVDDGSISDSNGSKLHNAC